MLYNKGMNRHEEFSKIIKELKHLDEQAQKTARSKKKLAVAAVFCVLFLTAALLGGAYFLPNVFLPEKEGYVHIRSDMTATEAAEELHEQGYVASPLFFRLATVVTGQAHEIKEGEYLINTDMSARDMLAKLTSGKTEAARLVIPEGYTVWQIAKTVAAMGKVSEEDFLAAARDRERLYPYMKSHRKVTFPAEGFLFPDTYFVPANATAGDIVDMMLKNFDDHLSDDMKRKIDEENLSIYQFVTLASLVEKEAKYEKDRPLIAAVFLNRLGKGMKLQSDASISYAMGNHKAAYSLAETKYDSPYNTYMYEGLPPGPIGNPGMDCMNAVLNAPHVPYLYFVADGDGHNYFATTYEEHMKNVEEHMP